MENRRKRILIIIIVFILVAILGTFSYAFFNYTRNGNPNTVSGGRMVFGSRQTKIINLSNIFPINPEESGVMNDNTRVGTFEVEIEGDTDYDNGLEYLISTTNAHIYTAGGKTIPVSIDVTVVGLGTENNNYFTARNSKNANIYKRLSGNVILGEQQLVAGYIKPNTTLGTKEGINGKITIKAYIDINRVIVSDTYDGTESNDMGVTNNWVNGRTVLTTAEWNALASTGISFQVKIEANDGIWVDEPMYNVMRTNAVMDNISSTNVSSSKGIDFKKISSDTNGKGLYIRSGTENDAYPVVYYRGNIDNNNVYFAGKCWQIIRTTETGGTKIIYNGPNTGTTSAPACENTTATNRQITLNVNGTSKNTFQFSGNNLYNSPAYNGYMYNTPVYSRTNGNYASGSKFGNGVTYNGTSYTITDVSDTLDANHHYTCGTANTITCSSIRYYFSDYTASGTNYYMYFTLTNGKTIENVVRESLENGSVESNAKAMVEQWYEENIDSTNGTKIEDAVYCNDRSIYSLGGLNPNGGTLTNTASTQMIYSAYKRNNVDYNPSIRCLRPQDAFTKESSNGNGLLDYPVGLITMDELTMAGGKYGTDNTNFYLTTGADYWSLSPYGYSYNSYATGFRVTSMGRLSTSGINGSFGLRPVVSLKYGTSIASGDGSAASPYIIK